MNVENVLTLADVVALHEETMKRMGWTPAPLRDEGALESAIMRPRQLAHYEVADEIRQAAVLAVGISQAQAFIDGNKRTAVAAMRVFLYRAGFRIVSQPAETAQELERVAEAEDRAKAGAAFEAWLREHVAPVASGP